MHDHSTKNYGPQISFIWTRPFDQDLWSYFIYSFICTRSFNQKLRSSLIYLFYLDITMRSKFLVLLSFIFSSVRDHPTKIRGHSDSLIYYFLNSANISSARFMTVLRLCFLRYIPLYFVHYIHGYMKSCE